MRNVGVKKRYVNGGVRLSFFVQESDVKPGEYCLILVEEAAKFDKMQQLLEQANQALRSCYSVIDREGLEANRPAIKNMINAVLGDQHRFLHPQQYADSGELSDDDAGKVKDKIIDNLRSELAEVERELAERSPGVMPEVVEYLVKLAEGSRIGHDRAAAYRVREYYAPPDGYRWELVDYANPITAEDVGRKVFHRNGGVDKVGEVKDVPDVYRLIVGGHAYAVSGRVWSGRESTADITHILRPVAPPFVFTGEPGIYETDTVGTVNFVTCKRGNIIILDCGRWRFVNHDGTFPGGRIVGRAGE